MQLNHEKAVGPECADWMAIACRRAWPGVNLLDYPCGGIIEGQQHCLHSPA
jgi:hypothetical protein